MFLKSLFVCFFLAYSFFSLSSLFLYVFLSSMFLYLGLVCCFFFKPIQFFLSPLLFVSLHFFFQHIFFLLFLACLCVSFFLTYLFFSFFLSSWFVFFLNYSILSFFLFSLFYCFNERQQWTGSHLFLNELLNEAKEKGILYNLVWGFWSELYKDLGKSSFMAKEASNFLSFLLIFTS